MNPLEMIMSVTEASAKWGIPSDAIIRLCREGRLEALQLDGPDGVWVLAKDQKAPPAALSRSQQTVSQQSAPRSSADKASLMHSKLRDALYE